MLRAQGLRGSEPSSREAARLCYQNRESDSSSQSAEPLASEPVSLPTDPRKESEDTIVLHQMRYGMMQIIRMNTIGRVSDDSQLAHLISAGE